MRQDDQVVAATVDVEPDHPMTVDCILWQLELVRRRLAVRWWGSEGAFAGYDDLQLACNVPVASGSVTFSARLLNADPTMHSVELVATTPSDAKATGSSRVIARGEGRTLQIQTAPVKYTEIA
jgi:hypothetical protein